MYNHENALMLNANTTENQSRLNSLVLMQYHKILCDSQLKFIVIEKYSVRNY